MKVQIYGKNFPVTPAIAEKIEKKLDHLDVYKRQGYRCLLFMSFI